jgi:hypothetical protein
MRGLGLGYEVCDTRKYAVQQLSRHIGHNHAQFGVHSDRGNTTVLSHGSGHGQQQECELEGDVREDRAFGTVHRARERRD